jgi:hypothetical protein
LEKEKVNQERKKMKRGLDELVLKCSTPSLMKELEDRPAQGTNELLRFAKRRFIERIWIENPLSTGELDIPRVFTHCSVEFGQMWKRSD